MCYCVNTSKQSSLKCCKENKNTHHPKLRMSLQFTVCIINTLPFNLTKTTTSYLLISTTLKRFTLTNISNAAKHFLQSDTTSKKSKLLIKTVQIKGNCFNCTNEAKLIIS